MILNNFEISHAHTNIFHPLFLKQNGIVCLYRNNIFDKDNDTTIKTLPCKSKNIKFVFIN